MLAVIEHRLKIKGAFIYKGRIYKDRLYRKAIYTELFLEPF